MIKRILEPEFMDTPEEAIDYDRMDHSSVNRLFVQDFLKIWNRQSPILDLGTGTAQIPIEFCQQSIEGEILAIDAAEHMLELAKINVQKAGFTKRIHLQKVDAKKTTYPAHSFPAIMSNSIIHHIPEPETVFAEITRLLAPHGVLLVRDLLRPNSTVEIDHLVNLYAQGANAQQRQLFWNSLHAALTLEEVRSILVQLGHKAEEVQQTTDRHWTWIKR